MFALCSNPLRGAVVVLDERLAELDSAADEATEQLLKMAFDACDKDDGESDGEGGASAAAKISVDHVVSGFAQREQGRSLRAGGEGAGGAFLTAPTSEEMAVRCPPGLLCQHKARCGATRYRSAENDGSGQCGVLVGAVGRKAAQRARRGFVFETRRAGRAGT